MFKYIFGIKELEYEVKRLQEAVAELNKKVTAQDDKNEALRTRISGEFADSIYALKELKKDMEYKLRTIKTTETNNDLKDRMRRKLLGIRETKDLSSSDSIGQLDGKKN